MKRVGFAATLSIALASTVQAQSAEPSFDAERNRQLTNYALADPSLRSALASGFEAVTFEAGTEKKVASVQASKESGPTIWTVKLFAPVDDPDDDQELANLRGLAATAKAQLGWSRQLTDWAFGVTDFKTWDDLCLRYTGEKDCDLFDPRIPDAERGAAASFTGMKTLIGVNGEFTRTKFSYVTGNNFAKATETHPQYAVTFTAGALPLRKGVYYTGVSFRYERSYKAQDKQEICLPIDGTTATRCSSLSIGAPSSTLKRIAEWESRLYFGSSAAINPIIAYDFNDSTLGVELPLYVIRNADGGLNGGVSVGWRSDTNEVTASVFVGTLSDVWK